MSTRRNGISRHQRVDNSRGEGGPNWILIAGGALLSTLSIRFGYKLTQFVDSKPHPDATAGLKRTCITSLLLHEDLGFIFYLIGLVVMQPMEHLIEENLEDAVCILAHLLVKGIRIVASTPVQVRVCAFIQL